MSTSKPPADASDEILARCVLFLKALGTFLPLRVALARNGYTADEHELGWKLLHKATGFFAPFPTENEVGTVQEAIAELDAADEPLFRRARAALGRLHPRQEQFVFDGLEPATGAAAVDSIERFLERLRELEAGASRASTREADQAALRTLAQRGVDESERERLRGLVRMARQTPEQATSTQSADELARDIDAVCAWYLDWSETARSVVTRRDHLIRLGLAKPRQSRKQHGDDPAPTLPAAATNGEPPT
jgi:hypothetical protein